MVMSLSAGLFILPEISSKVNKNQS